METAADSDCEEAKKEIFISYGREREVSEFVRQLKSDLEASGLSVWLDVEDIPAGSDWHGSIGSALYQCSVIVPVITQKYIGSRYCVNELYTADGDKKLIFPVMFEDVDLNSTEAARGIKFVISGINWSMCRPGVDDYMTSVQKLISGMKEKGVGLGNTSGSGTDSSPSHAALSAIPIIGPSSDVPLKMIPDLDSPAQIAVGANGEIAVACFQGNSVLVFDKNYEPLVTFGGQGMADGQFFCPSGVAIDQANHILVTSMHKIQKFTIDGKFIDGIGSFGKGELQFNYPCGLAIGKEQRIYVVEMTGGRVQILNSDFTYYGNFSKASPNLGSGRLNQPFAIAINSKGTVLVADTMNNAIQAFSPDGEFLFKLGRRGNARTPGAIMAPMGVAVDPDDYIYAACSGGPISIYDKRGEFVRTFGSYGSELGQFQVVKGMHVDRFGNLYISDQMSSRLQVFAGSPVMRMKAEQNQPVPGPVQQKYAYSIGPVSTTPCHVISDVDNPSAVATSKDGEVVVALFQEHKVQVYSKELQVIAEFTQEDLSARLLCPFGIAINENNEVLVSSSDAIFKFTLQGQFIEHFQGDHKFSGIRSIAIGKNGRIYVSENGKKRIQIFNSDMSFCGFASNPKLDKHSKDSPECLAVNSEGNVYLVDSGNCCIQVYSPEGAFLFKFGKGGHPQERGCLFSPYAIAIDKDDYVYVSCTYMILIFNKSGKFIRSLGGFGEDPGQFAIIRGLHIDIDQGLLFVCEWKNDRIQVFQL